MAAKKAEKIVTTAEADLVKVAALEAEKKAEEAVKKTVKKAEPIKKAAEEKKTEAKKKVEAKVEKAEKTVKKTVKKAAEKVVSEVVYVQYAEGETTIADITKKVKDQFVAEGHRASSIKSVRIYVKPEERAAYYVINDTNAGRVDLF